MSPRRPPPLSDFASELVALPPPRSDGDDEIATRVLSATSRKYLFYGRNFGSGERGVERGMSAIGSGKRRVTAEKAAGN